MAGPTFALGVADVRAGGRSFHPDYDQWSTNKQWAYERGRALGRDRTAKRPTENGRQDQPGRSALVHGRDHLKPIAQGLPPQQATARLECTPPAATAEKISFAAVKVAASTRQALSPAYSAYLPHWLWL
jgi:hypothetical protein